MAKKSLINKCNRPQKFSTREYTRCQRCGRPHGDYSANVAMRSCRLFGMKPRDLAEKLISEMKSDAIEKIEIAGPGFINFFLKKDALQSVIEKVLEQV